MEIINVTRSSLPPFEEYCREISDIWESRWLTNMGDKHKRLQAELEKYLAVPHITLYTNGHLALENMIEALELKGEIITTPYTFASTTHAIVRSGCTPVFCDIDPVDFTIDTAKIESLITEKTVGILPVHVYGNLCDTEKLAALAEKYGLKLMYDAAHAFGVEKNGVSAGNFGDVSMFSFHATKVFNTIEGGALCYSDEALVQKLYDIKNFGIHGPEDVPFIGGNAKMSEFQAAMGLCNLRHVDEEIEKRRAVCEHYDARLKGRVGLRLNAVQSGVKPNYAYYPVIFEGWKYSRDEVHARLGEHNIIARKYFYPATNDFECYRDSVYYRDTPVAREISHSVLTLPLYPDLPADDIDRICDIILG